MNNLAQINQQHEQAMELAEAAFFAKRASEMEKAKQLYMESFQLEKEAAMRLVDHYTQEPSRSVLFKGAATLALECEQMQEAERMIRFALLGSPPRQIKEELQEMLATIQMEESQLSPLEKYQQLPQYLQKEVADFIDFLLMKHSEVTAGI